MGRSEGAADRPFLFPDMLLIFCRLISSTTL